MKTHPEARDLVARINQRNGEILARADAAVGQLLRALFMVAVAALGGWCLAEYFTRCQTTAHLCMGVIGLHTRRREDVALDLSSPLQTKVVEASASARAAGELDGHKLGYIEGVRWGGVVGFCWGLSFGVVLIIVALQAGLLRGYL